MENTIQRQSACFEVGNYSNDQLRNLLKELHILSVAEAPAKVKVSETMSKLFELEVTSYNFWLDRYHNVCRAIEGEILYRIKTDKF